MHPDPRAKPKAALRSGFISGVSAASLALRLHRPHLRRFGSASLISGESST
ncbi:hypothetical protein TorRG33x02_226600 [Trema orientale]|uniref:Uncharacterized protein n=1 Tax=Trema orientale TaxID=63057 RepID=A0A2P5E7L1_TREOI|nr:hypothetical protein TorRG33x02_226600 [Trema orientale]